MPPIFVGSTELTTVGDIKIGGVDVQEVFVGATQVFPSGAPPIDPTITFTWDTENDQALPGGTTFTRASIKNEFDGTSYNELASGVIPENSAAVGGGAQGFGPEPAATNLIRHSVPSEAFWSSLGDLTLTSLGVGSIGLEVIRADSLTTTDRHGQFEDVNGGGGSGLTSGEEYTFSINAIDDTGTFLALRGASPNTIGGRFNLSTGAITSTETGTAAVIKDLGSGWFKNAITWTATATGSGNIAIATDDSGSAGLVPRNYTGANDTIDVANAQVEITNFATSPIVTSATTLTRAADVLDTGVAITTAFSALLDLTLPEVVGTGNTITLLGPDATAEDILRVDASFNVIMDDGGTPVTIGTSSAGARIKVAYGRDAGDRSGSLNGATAVDGDAPGAGHVGDNFQLGSANSVNQSRCIHHLTTLFDEKKSDAELEALAS